MGATILHSNSITMKSKLNSKMIKLKYSYCILALIEKKMKIFLPIEVKLPGQEVEEPTTVDA